MRVTTSGTSSRAPEMPDDDTMTVDSNLGVDGFQLVDHVPEQRVGDLAQLVAAAGVSASTTPPSDAKATRMASGVFGPLLHARLRRMCSGPNA